MFDASLSRPPLPSLKLLASLIHMYSRKVRAVYNALYMAFPHLDPWHFKRHSRIPQLRGNISSRAKIAFEFDEITSIKSYILEAKRGRKSMDGIDANRILPDSCLEAHMYLLNVRKKEAVVFSYLFYIWIHDTAIPYGAWDKRWK